MSVLPGDTIATPPSGAEPRIGISAAAQPELYVPMTPSTLVSAAYALALASQIGLLHRPVAASESSHAWKPTFVFPAFQPALRSSSLTAVFICAERWLDAPRSGRSETITASALPGPSYWSGPQVADATATAPAGAAWPEPRPSSPRATSTTTP